MMGNRVTIRDLEALLGAIDIMQDAIESGAENQSLIDDAEHAANCRKWLMNEISRRKSRVMVRNAVNRAKQVLLEPTQ